MGDDRTGILPVVVADLRRHGFVPEAEAVLALYGPREERLARGRALLQAAYENHRQVSPGTFEFLEDNRRPEPPRVSVIVSLYRAANKFEAFLRMLAQQPWFQDGRAELVFVDSHSPTDEHAVFQRVAASVGLTAVYARTEARETIQKAWNRGILLARAPYLAFLGVDEMVRPHCFATLSAELDADPSLDWVQGNSVITEVNRHGTPQRDVMRYHRIPYAQDLVYLETCYLSWVGGLYRKSIHERFGYYDESFRAAGDTEFKNRILPFIKSKTLPMTLGVFLNYPEERTTQSPRAEIEDLRAWYLHRSQAGVEYAMARREPEDAWRLFQRAIRYRKSYCGHLSSDLDYAGELAAYLSRRAPSPQIDACAASVQRALAAYIAILIGLPELFAPGPRPASRTRPCGSHPRKRSALKAAIGGQDSIVWSIFNDNRYQQHFDVWAAPALAPRHVPGERTGVVSCPFPPTRSALTVSRAHRIGRTYSRSASACSPSCGKQRRKVRPGPDRSRPRPWRKWSSTSRPWSRASIRPRCPATTPDRSSARSGQKASSGARGRRAAASTNPWSSSAPPSPRPPARLSPEWSDAVEGLAHHAAKELEKSRSMDVAARLLSCKSPAEAVQRQFSGRTQFQGGRDPAERRQVRQGQGQCRLQHPAEHLCRRRQKRAGDRGGELTAMTTAELPVSTPDLAARRKQA